MIIDIIVVAALLVSAVIAFLRGFIREVLTVLGVVGGLFASIYMGPLLSPGLRNLFAGTGNGEPDKIFGVVPVGMAVDALSYGSIFIIVVLILSVISHFLASWAKAVGLGALDRTFGVIFGILRGVVLLALLYLPVFLFVEEETRKEWIADSRTGIYVETVSGWMSKFLPESMSDNVGEKAEQAAEAAAKATRKKLQELDILRPEDKVEKENYSEENASARPRSPGDGDSGYKKDQRQELNQLFEDGLNDR